VLLEELWALVLLEELCALVLMEEHALLAMLLAIRITGGWLRPLSLLALPLAIGMIPQQPPITASALSVYVI